MNLFEKNREFLLNNNKSQLNFELIEDSEKIKLIYENKEESEFFQKDSEIYEIKYELDSANLPNSKIREIYFILGFSNINELSLLLKSANSKSIFYIVEPSPEFFNYTINQKDLKLLAKYDLRFYCDDISLFPNFIENILSTEETLLIRNIKIYSDYYYRTFDMKMCLNIVKTISKVVKHNLFKFGNSIEDSLIGLANNTYNLRFLKDSLDFTKMKNLFVGKPAIIVAAGPSLEKNIIHLKSINNSALILAVDTIAERLVKEGIIPHFVFAIERIYEVYDYFFKDKKYPTSTILVAPPVIYPKIIEDYNGKFVLPFRDNVNEYKWFNNIYDFGEDVYLSMGISVAHLAFGFANHLGCSPIILTGQDLAHGNNGTHVQGTIYDNKPVQKTNETILTSGYHGGEVKTSQIWLEFKKWFELEIKRKELKVINATEGGALIKYTKQTSLYDCINLYCKDTFEIEELINNVPNYQLKENEISKRFQKKVNDINNIIIESENTLKSLKLLKINESSSTRDLQNALENMKITDIVLKKVMNNPLLMHNLQAFLIVIFQKFNRVLNELNFKSVYENLIIQIELLETISFVGKMIIETISINNNLTYEDFSKVQSN